MSTTNPQAALLAAATMYQGQDVSPNTVQGMAAHFRRWLDRQDAEPLQAQAQLQVSPAAVAATPGPRPRPPAPLQFSPGGLAAQIESAFQPHQ
jgi:hypothetical protein